VLGQFSRFVRPGAVRHDVTGLPKGVRAMAFANGAKWSVVAWNETADPPRTSTGLWLVALPPQTVVTYTFS